MKLFLIPNPTLNNQKKISSYGDPKTPKNIIKKNCSTKFYPPASEASREVENLTERKNPHTPVYGVKEFVCLSVCLSVTKFDPNYFCKPVFASKTVNL